MGADLAWTVHQYFYDVLYRTRDSVLPIARRISTGFVPVG